jgi:hypothetical protein
MDLPVEVYSVLGVLGYMALARRYLRFEPPTHVTPQTLETLSRRYRVWEAIAIVPLFLFIVSLGFAWDYALWAIAGRHLRSLGPSMHLLAPPHDMWRVAALFLGILSATLPMHWLYQRLLGEGYEEYTLYTNLKYRFDTWKAFRVIAYPLGVFCVVFVVLGLDCYIRLTPQAIVINRFLGLGETRYAYGQVRELKVAQFVRAPNGNVVLRPHVVVEFTDGFRLTTNGAILDQRLERDVAALRYVARQSGKPIQQVEFDEGEKS